MNFEEIKSLAFIELKRRGIQNFRSIPPIIKLYWLLGINIRPPHYSSFSFNLFHFGAWFGAVMGTANLILMPEQTTISFIIKTTLFSLIIGSYSAFYYQNSAKKNHLSHWDYLRRKVNA